MTGKRESTDEDLFDSPLERALLRPRALKFQLWQALLLMLFLLAGALVFATLAVRGGEDDAGFIDRAAHAIALAPSTAHRVITDLMNGYNPQLTRGQRFKGESGFHASRPQTGYVLLSRYDGDEQRGVVELLDLSSGKVLHRWRPDVAAMNALSKLDPSVVNLARDFTPRRYMEHHPVALPDGSIVFHGMDSPLVRIDACSNVMWTLDGEFHHSIERDANGDFWTVETLNPPTIPFVDKDFDDDAVAQVSPDGRLLFSKSVAQMLIDSDLRHIVYSHDEYDPDPVHLNDVQPALADGRYWKKGDLFLSLRNPSMLALYRPSEDRLVWSKEGPWLMQHDVDIVSDHEIAAFSNNTAATPKGGRTIGANDIIFYDFETDEIYEPFKAALAKNKVRTETAGLFRLYRDGVVMVEEHDYGRLLAMDPEGEVLWRYVNRAKKDGRVYHLGWSRALTEPLASELIAALGAKSCG